jgi:hypothetical protein
MPIDQPSSGRIWFRAGDASINVQRAISHIAPLLAAQDAKLKQQVCSTLGQIAKHSAELVKSFRPRFIT